MRARWPLRWKLGLLVVAAFVPILGLAAWDAYNSIEGLKRQRTTTLASALESAAARYAGLADRTKRLVATVCGDEAVARGAELDASSPEVTACGIYLERTVKMFAPDYSAALVTDANGIARCASFPAIVGMAFDDRALFRQARDTRSMGVGAPVASSVTRLAVVPVVQPIMRDGQFAGVCSIDMSLASLGDTVSTLRTESGAAVALVDRNGMSIGGGGDLARNLPVSGRLASAIAGDQVAFNDYGQDGLAYTYAVRPLIGSLAFTVAAVPMASETLVAAQAAKGLLFVLLSLAAALSAIWVGADRWCVRPLRYIRDYADKVSRGDAQDFVPPGPWTPELLSVGEGVTTMAAAIASREAELRAGLEQRDHMLREIHHRVKNNLQMISSLLNLQAGEIRSPRIRRYFGDAQNRVLTLSILHRHLYERTSWSLVDFQRFISDLVRQISVVDAPHRLVPPRFHIRAPIMAVGPDTAIPVGLIVTEAVSAALRHDFSASTNPEIRIEATEAGGQVTLSIEDNGVDRNADASKEGERGVFGLTLIRGLAMQLGGELVVTPTDTGGTRLVVAFPVVGDQAGDT